MEFRLCYSELVNGCYWLWCSQRFLCFSFQLFSAFALLWPFFMLPLAMMCSGCILEVLHSLRLSEAQMLGVLSLGSWCLSNEEAVFTNYHFPWELHKDCFTSLGGAPTWRGQCVLIQGVKSAAAALPSSCLCVHSQFILVGFFYWGSLHLNKPSVWHFLLLTTRYACLHA